MKSFKSQTKSTTRLSVSSITPIKKSSTMTTTTNTKTKPKTTTKTLSNKDSKVTTTSSKVSTTTATTTTKNFSSSKLSTTAKTSTTSTGKNLPKENRNSRHINSKTSTTSSSTTVKKKTKEKQEKINTISTNLPILENEVKSPIRSEINSVMHEIEKFRTNLHELSRVQEKRNENISSSKNLGLIQDEMMIQAVQNQLSVVRQHITSIMDNYKSDENLLTVIMTYNEEVNIALQEALQEVPKLYQSHLKPPPSPSSSSSLSSQFNDYISVNDPQQIIESQKIQIQFLEKANFNNVVQLINDIERCQLNLENFIKFNNNLNINLIESKILLRKYDIKIDLDNLYEKNLKYYKVLLSQILQRLLLETVLEHSDIYFTGSLSQNNDSNDNELFQQQQHHHHQHHHHHHQFTKINPEVYAVLGSNGFDGFEHPFVEFVGEKLIEIIEKYFVIENRQKSINLANELIHNIINVFYFRMQSQDPTAHYKWLEYGEDLDLEIMSIIDYNTYYNNVSLPGDYINDEDFDAVGICSFPVIGKRLKDQDKSEVYTKAKVLPNKIRFSHQDI
ncbi:hypothetical protein RclHR1_03260009 [Rhizophagus clarus]|uniref:Uncharacterized protein n=1 Tax=Rhizophagus clarus TaxID=94130 RepID=A0A2Z6RPR0_9GLOM|nr:hypothetical protein RclHR1_03260009 [Rhizophagus clarus]GES76948.1 hypothetical protein GLOIN_2v1639068 [Rhizophagus clarus]